MDSVYCLFLASGDASTMTNYELTHVCDSVEKCKQIITDRIHMYTEHKYYMRQCLVHESMSIDNDYVYVGDRRDCNRGCCRNHFGGFVIEEILVGKLSKKKSKNKSEEKFPENNNVSDKKVIEHDEIQIIKNPDDDYHSNHETDPLNKKHDTCNDHCYDDHDHDNHDDHCHDDHCHDNHEHDHHDKHKKDLDTIQKYFLKMKHDHEKSKQKQNIKVVEEKKIKLSESVWNVITNFGKRIDTLEKK